MKKLLITFIIITGCSTYDDKLSNNNLDIKFSDNMSFEEFKVKLEKYANNSPYPNIDEQMSNVIKIAIIGLGQVGNYLYRELNLQRRNIEIKTAKKIKIIAISAKNKTKKRKYHINKKIFYKNPIKIIKELNPDILFEVIGLSDGISKKVVETALKNKIHVITPNKALIAKHGDHLAKLAEKNRVNLEFEASVAGGIPILRTIKESLATNKISKVYGILNGTTNYILSEMEKSNETFEKV